MILFGGNAETFLELLNLPSLDAGVGAFPTPLSALPRSASLSVGILEGNFPTFHHVSSLYRPWNTLTSRKWELGYSGHRRGSRPH
jgi:hypothetical protein